MLSEHHCLSHCVNGHLARDMRAFAYLRDMRAFAYLRDMRAFRYLRTHTEFHNVYCEDYDSLFKGIMDMTPLFRHYGY